jgi:hypothetical protein
MVCNKEEVTMANMGDKVCLNHTNVRAVTRCETCFRPLCAECVVEADGRHFCSEKCAGDSIDKRGRIAVLDKSNAKSQSVALVKNIIILLVLIGIAAGAFFYWQGHKKEVARASAQMQRTLKQAGNKAEAVKNTAVQKVAAVGSPSTNNAIKAKQQLGQ